MTHEEIRKNHFERLNGYRHSVEYAEYAKWIESEAPQGELPSLIGNRWEIDRDIYREFLEILPPLGWRGGTFYLQEFSFGDITTKYTKEGDKYYCEFARYPARKQARQPTETPWGIAQTAEEIAPGITLYTTASHGGYHLSPARIASMPKPLRDFKPWAGASWYEEDADWSIVALAFPQFFPADAIPAALATLKHYKPALYEEVVAAGIGQRGGRG